MAQPEQFDILVLGHGTAGKLIAWQWRDRAGGLPSWSAGGSGTLVPTSPCMPSKNEIRSGQPNILRPPRGMEAARHD